MSRAHRLGKFNQTKTRPIIAAFQDYNIAEKIIKNGHTLREKVYSVSRDYPVEITRARKTLWPQYKRLKQENPLAKVAIVYPAKLISNGELAVKLTLFDRLYLSSIFNSFFHTKLKPISTF